MIDTDAMKFELVVRTNELIEEALRIPVRRFDLTPEQMRRLNVSLDAIRDEPWPDDALA